MNGDGRIMQMVWAGFGGSFTFQCVFSAIHIAQGKHVAISYLTGTIASAVAAAYFRKSAQGE